jgi:peptide deformylase
MSVMEILTFPHPILKKRAAEIERIDKRVRQLAEHMTTTMYKAPGIGLAAPQVGVSERLIVIDLSIGEEEGQLLVIANPEIICQEGELEIEEGCLSLPEFAENVKRCQKVVVRGLDMEGKSITIEGEDLMAVALQHEIDHLDGILFIDHISRLKRSRYITKRKKELAELERENK